MTIITADALITADSAIYTADGGSLSIGIASNIQKLNPGALVELFVFDGTSIGAGVIRWHNGANELGTDVIFDGETYTRYPIEANGFEMTTKGTIPRPVLRLANITGLMSALARENSDLLGAKITRIRTFKKYIDAVNFSGGNPTADPNARLPDEVWYIDRKASENGIFIEFELSAPFDVYGVKLPRRQCIQNVCIWQYRSVECGYTGDPVATKNDETTSNPSLDQCGKRLASCKLRFGEFAELPFGGFPGVGLQ